MFQGIIILDLTRVFAGPFTTRQFADYGATVIKIENPAYPDDARTFPPYRDGVSGYFEMLNRNKQVRSLDFKNEQDRNVFYELVKNADVVVENFSPTIKKKLFIDYETLDTINDRLIYVSISGYGQHSDKKAYDVIVQAESGLASLNGETKPMKNSPAVTDAFAGIHAAFAISSALYARTQTGKGQYIDVSMVGCALHMLESNITETSLSCQNPPLCGNHDNVAFPFGFFKTSDGYVSLAIVGDTLREIFRQCFLPTLSVDMYCTNAMRLSHKDYLLTCIEDVFATYTTQDLLLCLGKIGIPAGQIRTMTDLLADTELFTHEYLKKVDHPVLGSFVVPYFPIKYSTFRPQEYKHAPSLSPLS